MQLIIIEQDQERLRAAREVEARPVAAVPNAEASSRAGVSNLGDGVISA